MKQRYAVLWCSDEEVETGRLEPHDDGFDLHGRHDRLSVPFAEVVRSAIARGSGDRLRGLPVLALRLRRGTYLRIASLEGAGALHELAECIERGAVTFAA